MSGLCGWFAAQPAALTIESMAAPIARYERTPLRTATHAAGSVALSGSIDCTSLLQEDGLIVALWGSPGQHAATLAARWRSHGPWSCAALSGQFAFAILDQRHGEALLAVDRFATRPLYFQQVGAGLLFASSQDALLRHPQAGREASAQALYQYLVLGVMGGSARSGQQQLEPGQCLHLRGGTLVRHTWWRMRFAEHGNNADNNVTARPGSWHSPAPGSALHSALDAALAGARAPAQQPAGVMLGGAGSAVLAARMRQPDGTPLPTFAVGYAGAGRMHDDHDERQDCQDKPGACARHYQQIITPADLVDAIPKLAALADRPCGDTSVLADYHCALLARAHGTLRLMNCGGLAELFGAGPLACSPHGLARYVALPASVRQLLIEPLLQRLGGGALVQQLRRELPQRLVHASRFGAQRGAALLAPALREQVDLEGPLAMLQQCWWSAQCRSAGNRAIALELRHGLAPQLAASTLGCTLAGVDVAYPFLDDAIVDCAAHTAPGLKHPGWRGVHAGIVRALAPGPFLRRAPQRALPLAAWLQSEPQVRALAFDSLAGLRRREIVDASVIDALLSCAPGALSAASAALVWQLMMLEQWFVQRARHAGRMAPAQQMADWFAAPSVARHAAGLPMARRTGRRMRCQLG